MDPYSITLIFATELLRYLTVVEQNMTPEDRARRQRVWALFDRFVGFLEQLEPPKGPKAHE